MIEIAFRARNPHELLVHEIASRCGAYAEAGIAVRAADGVGRNIDELEHTFGLGDVLLTSQDLPKWRILLVYTDQPLFWLYARRPLATLRRQPTLRVALHQRHSAPFELAVMAFERLGFDLERVEVDEQSDDYEKLSLIRERALDAGVFGSAIAPSLLTQAGLSEIVCIGDVVRFPTTGIATRQFDPDVEHVAAVQERAWRHATDNVVVDALTFLVPSLSREDALEVFRRDYRERMTPRRADLDPSAYASCGGDARCAVATYERKIGG